MYICKLYNHYLNKEDKKHYTQKHSLFLGSSSGCSSLSSGLFPLLLGASEVASVSLLHVVLLGVQRGATLRPARVLSVDLGSLLGLLSALPLIHDVYHALRGQILKTHTQLKQRMQRAYLVDVFVVDLDHRCVDACSEAFNLADSEQTVLAGLIHIDVSMLLDSLDDVSRTSQLARGCSAHLQVILADLGPIEHGVEGGDLVDLHGLHIEDLGDFVHCGESEEVIVLLLRDEQGRDACRLLIVRGVFVEQLLYLLVVLFGELERRVLVVVLSVPVVRKRTERTLRCGRLLSDCQLREELSQTDHFYVINYLL